MAMIKGKQKKVLAILLGLVLLIGLGLYGGNFFGKAAKQGTVETISYQTKDATKEVGSKENPFTVLEIVPSKDMAAFGYLIPGCEPVKNLSTDTTGAMEAYKSIYAGADGIASVADVTGKAFRNDMPDNLGFSDTFINDNLLVADAQDAYGEYGYFLHVADGAGAYKYADDMGCFVPVAVDDAAGQNTYDWVPLAAYVENLGGTGGYIRLGNTYTNEKLNTGDAQAAYYTFAAGSAEGQTSYDMQALVADVGAEDRTAHAEDSIEAGDIGSQADVEGKRIYTYRCEEKHVVYNVQTIQHKDNLIQTLFPGKSSENGFVSQVITVSPEDLSGSNVTGENNIITDADMIVIHDATTALPIYQAANHTGKNADVQTRFDTSCDLSSQAYEAILKRQASGDPAVMLLDASSMAYTEKGDAKADLLVEKLYVALNKYGAKYFYNVFCPDASGQREQDPDAAGSQTFFYAHAVTGLQTTKASYVLDWDGSDSLLRRTLDADATSLLTDLSSKRIADGKRAHMRILEIQPIPSYIYGNPGWKSYYCALLPDFIGTDSDIARDLTVTCMATYECNSKVEDLNANYDLIIIGVKQDETNGLNGYNDTSLGNLAYTTVGDLVSTDSGYTYYIDPDFFAFDKIGSWGRYDKDQRHWIFGKLDAWNMNDWSESFIGSQQGSDIAQAKIRYEATDLSKTKYQEILDFSQKNPVVIDDGLYAADQTQVDTDLVDESSFVYNLAKVGLRKNDQTQQILSYSKAVEADSLLESWMQEDQCSLTFSADDSKQGEDGKPVAYDPTYGSQTVSWNKGKDSATIDQVLLRSTANDQTDAEGNPVLRYHFSLQGKADALYQVRLYVDSNGNGSFEKEECSSEPTITDTTEGALNGTTANGTLLAGHSYTVERALPATQAGMLPWKLEVSAVDAASDRDSAIGYTRIANYGQKETIHVLQMNLTADMKTDATSEIRFADRTTEVGAKFAAYLDNVEDFDVDIDYRSNSWFMNNYEGKPEEWASDLQKYDMLILGFSDISSFTDQEDFVYGFQKFVASGKSVILGHDIVQDKSFAYPSYNESTQEDSRESGECWSVDQATSMYLRELSGQMVRYYSNQSEGGSYEKTYSRGQEISLLPEEDMEVGYYWKWHRYNSWNPASGYWAYHKGEDIGEEGKWMTRDDYLSKLTSTGESICNLMDNSIRVMTYGARLRKTTGNGIDRTIYSPADQMKKVDDTTLDWTKSVETETVRIANQGQITTYPYKMEDTIRVGTTHAQNYRLNLENATGAGLNFKVEGDYSDWKDVPKQTIGYDIQKKNEVSLVYIPSEKKAYGYYKVTDSNKDDDGTYTSMLVKVYDEDGNQMSYAQPVFGASEDGTIITDIHPSQQKIGQTITYYMGKHDKSTNINNLYQGNGEDGSWRDIIWGKMSVTRYADYAEVEYEIDVDQYVAWGNQHMSGNWPNNKTDADNVAKVEVIHYSLRNFSAGEFASSDFTKEYIEQYVEQASASGDRAIVWYNLSNDADDATNIYAAREGDASNNYYLYTKGNITYTGLGHSGTMTDDEIRLFVNTMISSFRSQEAAPYLTVTNEEAIHNGSISTFYTQDRGADTQDIVAHLLVNDASISNQTKTYQLTIRDENGKLLADHVAVKKEDIYDLRIAASDVLAGQKTYTATLESSYVQEGKNYTTEDTVIIRAMVTPLFDLY